MVLIEMKSDASTLVVFAENAVIINDKYYGERKADQSKSSSIKIT